jgi:AraC-like DNA-binding protein
LENSTSPGSKFYLYHRIVKAKLFIDNNYSENIDLDNISGEAHFSKFHFIRLFKSVYGKTPHQYLTQVRIEKARELLNQTIAVSEICYKVGFDSVSSFTGLFKRTYSQTPSAYQRLCMLKREKIKLEPLSFIPNCFAEHNGWKINSNFREVV